MTCLLIQRNGTIHAVTRCGLDILSRKCPRWTDDREAVTCERCLLILAVERR